MSKCMPCYTNRQLIAILSSVWRIPDDTFLSMQARIRPPVSAPVSVSVRGERRGGGKSIRAAAFPQPLPHLPQEAMVRELDRALENDRSARRVLRSFGGLSAVLCEDMLRALNAGVPITEPFHQEIMRCIRQWHLQARPRTGRAAGHPRAAPPPRLPTRSLHPTQELLGRARIFVQDGATLFGVMDETGLLEYGEVFAQVTDWERGEEGRPTREVSGPVAVTKFPALHPGDVRALRGVSVGELEARAAGPEKAAEARRYFGGLVNVLVFPQKGPRPHPNEMAGSDLDGAFALRGRARGGGAAGPRVRTAAEEPAESSPRPPNAGRRAPAGDEYFLTWDRRLIPPPGHENGAPRGRRRRPGCADAPPSLD